MTHVIVSWAEPTNVKLAQLRGLIDFPDFVKQASLDSLRPTADVGPGAFADPVYRDYPCHSREATWLSLADFTLRGKAARAGNTSRIEARLNSFAKHWGLEPDFAQITKTAAELDRGLPDSDYAYIYDNGSVKHRSLRIKDAAEVVKAAEYLEKFAGDIRLDHRMTIATRILDKAASLGAAVPTHNKIFLEKQAGMGSPISLTAVVSALQGRARLLRDSNPELASKLASVITSCSAHPEFLIDQTRLVKMASMLEQIDVVAGLVGNYTFRLPSPNDVCFSITPSVKEAADNDVIKTTTGRIYDSHKLKSVKLADVREHLGSPFVEKVRDGILLDTAKLARELVALPQDKAKLFDMMMQSKGLDADSQRSPHLLNVV